jgi:hypothetical protein
MTMTRVALKYCDYLVERVAAVGDADIAALDLSMTTPHFRSSGPCEPIENSGAGPLYRVIETDVPAWLEAGLSVLMSRESFNTNQTPRTWAARIMLMDLTGGWIDGLRELDSMRGKFGESLRAQWSARGWLSPKQRACIGRYA